MSFRDLIRIRYIAIIDWLRMSRRIELMMSYGKKAGMVIALCGCMQVYAEPVSSTAATAVKAVSSSKDEEIKKTVLGIMSYTRWTPPPTPINFCIVAAKHASALEHLDAMNSANGVSSANDIVVTKLDYNVTTLSTQCDVIYFGNVSPADQQKVLAARQNHTILTINEDNTDCEIGSSFCLQTSAAPITFLVNLDSLARSGVRVDPNVLLLGKQRTAP